MLLLTDNGEKKVVSMKLKVSETKFLEYRYELKPGEYMVDFAIRSQGLNDVISSTSPIKLDWNLKARRNEKSLSYEQQNSYLHYNADEVDCFTYTADESDEIEAEKSMHHKMYEIATAKYNPFSVGGSESIHDFQGGSENASRL